MNHKITKNESDTIFIMKSIGIIAVVVGHYDGILFNLAHAYYYHMPLFFFLSGIFIRDNVNYRKLAINTIKTIKYIIITYLIIGILAVYLSGRFGFYLGQPFKRDILSTLQLIYNRNFHNNTLFLVAWFLFAYSISMISSSLIISITNNIRNIITKSVFLISIAIALGYISVNILAPEYKETKKQLINLASQVCFSSMFMIIGNKTWRIMMKIKNKVIVPISLIVIIILYRFFINGNIGIAWSHYPAGLIPSLAIAISSIFFILIVSSFLCKTKVKNIAMMPGIYSKHIMSYHLFIFVILDIIVYKLGYWDISKTTALNHYLSSSSQFIYPVISVTAPVIICVILKKIIKTNSNITPQ